MLMSFIIDIKVVPSSGRITWKIDKLGQLKCYLKSPPERGKANKELIKLLAKALGIKQYDITIITGRTGRKKRIRIEKEITLSTLLTALGIDWQLDLFRIAQKEGV